MLSTSRLIIPYKHEYDETDWSTPIKHSLHKKAKEKHLIHMATYTPSELEGFYTHGIKTKLQVLMNIMKDKAILSQNNITKGGKNISQHTGYYGSEKDRISFSMFGDGKISEMYGIGGITLISNNINPYRAKSHMPYEWFCNDSVSFDNLTIAIDKEFAQTHIVNLNAKDIFHWEYRDNNYCMIIRIINFLRKESGIPMMSSLYNREFSGLSSISSSSSSSLDEDEDEDDLDEISLEEFNLYYILVLEHFIEKTGDLFPNTVLNLVIALLRHYELNGVKIILIDYEQEEN